MSNATDTFSSIDWVLNDLLALPSSVGFACISTTNYNYICQILIAYHYLLLLLPKIVLEIYSSTLMQLLFNWLLPFNVLPSIPNWIGKLIHLVLYWEISEDVCFKSHSWLELTLQVFNFILCGTGVESSIASNQVTGWHLVHVIVIHMRSWLSTISHCWLIVY